MTLCLTLSCLTKGGIATTIKLAIKLTIKLKIIAAKNKMLMRAATVVHILHGLFYVLLQLLVVTAIILSFKFYCKFYYKFYCSCDPSLKD